MISFDLAGLDHMTFSEQAMESLSSVETAETLCGKGEPAHMEQAAAGIRGH